MQREEPPVPLSCLGEGGPARPALTPYRCCVYFWEAQPSRPAAGGVGMVAGKHHGNTGTGRWPCSVWGRDGYGAPAATTQLPMLCCCSGLKHGSTAVIAKPRGAVRGGTVLCHCWVQYVRLCTSTDLYCTGKTQSGIKPRGCAWSRRAVPCPARSVQGFGLHS